MGQIDPILGELHDLRFADPERAIAVAEANRDLIVGFKVRVSEMLAGPNGIAGLERALEAGKATGLPVMVHIGGTPFGLEEVVDRLRPGRRRDAFVHRLAARGILTRRRAGRGGRARGPRAGRPVRRRSRRRQLQLAVAEAALADGFRPDSISTDLHRFNVAGPVHDLATTMSKFLLLGCRSTTSSRWSPPRRRRPSG